MDELRTTPHDFICRVNIGVNRTFDDDTYYVNYYDENNNFAHYTAYTDTEIILKQINSEEAK